MSHLDDSYEDGEGWLVARCTCGWEFGPVPDKGTAADVMMEHAAASAYSAARAVDVSPPRSTDGAGRIGAERARQVERWGAAHDTQHDDQGLVHAAIAYATEGIARQFPAPGPLSLPHAAFAHTDVGMPGPWWPWEIESWKPSSDPIRNLEKAGALIAAEIDRLLAARDGSER